MIINFYPENRSAEITEEKILLATLPFVESKKDVENILNKFSLKLRTRWRKAEWGFVATCRKDGKGRMERRNKNGKETVEKLV